MMLWNRSFRRSARLGGVVALAVFGLLAAPVTAARADQGGGGNAPGGYTVSVHVSYSGDAAPAAGGDVTVKASCWWSPAGGPYTDAVKMLAWYKGVTGGVQSPGMVATYGPLQIWQDAANSAKAGHPMSWYMAYCVNSADLSKFHLGQVPIVDPVNGQTFGYYMYHAFAGGTPPPPPLVDPADLAQAAYDKMVIPEPVTDRNPKIDAAGAPTLVGLPTWFWVTDPAAVGGDSGTRTIRAQIDGSDIWAEVVARTDGLSISSGAGGADCSPAQALTAYAKGAKEGGACTVSFDHASVGDPQGWPVTFSTGWNATWTGSGGTGGDLAGETRANTVDIPVAEVQNVVTQ
jgi:hypothetical protein